MRVTMLIFPRASEPAQRRGHPSFTLALHSAKNRKERGWSFLEFFHYMTIFVVVVVFVAIV